MTPHVRQLVLAVASVLALAVVCAVAWTPRPNAAVRPSGESRHPAVPAERVPVPPLPSGPVRNVFEFADRAPVEAAPLPAIAVPPPLDLEPIAVPTPSPLRLVGFVRKGGVLRAALSVNGVLAVLARGEESDGYVVTAIEEDSGVAVRGPDGTELVLTPPPS